MARHLYLLFFLSGLSGLCYEAIWSRYLRLFVGSAATAQVLVLALFMGGMSLGAILAGKRSARIKRPILAYGIIEGFIGLYAVLFPWLFHTATRYCYDVVFPALEGGAAVTTTKWLVAGLLILPPCVLLGMTFPLMSVGILRRMPQRSGEVLSLLYFTNSFGASIGAMLTGFLLVPCLGLPNSLLTAAALNFVIFLVLLRERKADPPLEHGTTESNEPVADAGDPRRRLLATLFLLTAFGTGMSSFMYEIGWIRLLSMVIGSATHSFEVMLSAFVFGLALGGLWVRKRMDKFKRPIRVLAIVQIVMGVSAVATLPLYRVAVEGMSWVFYQDERTQGMWVLFNIVRYLLCLLIMLPATFCAGMTLPLLTHVLLRRGHPESTVGRVYGVNTLGAIVGAIAAGLILMPIIGLKNVILLGALADMVLAVLILRLDAQERSREEVPTTPSRSVFTPMTAGLAAVVVMAAGFFLVHMDPAVLASSVFRKGKSRMPKELTTLMHKDGRTATVTLVERDKESGHRTIMTNGKPDASVRMNRRPAGRALDLGPQLSADDPTQILLALVPAMLRPKASEWAMIGIGSGVSSHVALGSPVLKRLDTIEIEPVMAEAARQLMPLNARMFEDPRSHLIIDDAKAYFASANRKYDVIVSEPSNPWVSGVSSLFSVEFYREVKRHMAPRGVLAQWIHGYELNDALLFSVLAAADREFSDYQVYRVGGMDWVIVASQDEPVGQLSAEPLGWPKMKQEALILGIHQASQVATLLVANKQLLHPYLSKIQPNSDEYPILDTGAERARFFNMGAGGLLALRAAAPPLLQVLGGLKRPPYPPVGIQDNRGDRHVLADAEKALALNFTHGTGRSTDLSQEMVTWLERTKKLDGSGQKWDEWFEATFLVYQMMAPSLDLRDIPWWDHVKQVLEANTPPEQLKIAVELLDAIVQRKGQGLRDAMARTMRARASPYEPRFLGLVGAVALESTNSPPAERKRFVQQFMSQHGNGQDGADIAFQIVRAYVNR